MLLTFMFLLGVLGRWSAAVGDVSECMEVEGESRVEAEKTSAVEWLALFVCDCRLLGDDFGDSDNVGCSCWFDVMTLL